MTKIIQTNENKFDMEYNTQKYSLRSAIFIIVFHISIVIVIGRFHDDL
jgi:hypothetical protein